MQMCSEGLFYLAFPIPGPTHCSIVTQTNLYLIFDFRSFLRGIRFLRCQYETLFFRLDNQTHYCFRLLRLVIFLMKLSSYITARSNICSYPDWLLDTFVLRLPYIWQPSFLCKHFHNTEYRSGLITKLWQNETLMTKTLAICHYISLSCLILATTHKYNPMKKSITPWKLYMYMCVHGYMLFSC